MGQALRHQDTPILGLNAGEALRPFNEMIRPRPWPYLSGRAGHEMGLKPDDRTPERGRRVDFRFSLTEDDYACLSFHAEGLTAPLDASRAR